tara:strand:+ start:1266 stop:1598 length:333 start_codon:yes stop_codon:yes gene_type:complete
MEYQFDTDLNLHFYSKAIEELKGYYFFCDASLQIKNKVEIVYFDDQYSINESKSALVNYSEVKDLIKSKFVVQIFANEDRYSIIISPNEVCVRSLDRKIAENIFSQLLDN